MEQSRTPIGSKSRLSTPIACRICHKLFFDNVSLVLHFDSHLEDKTPSSAQLSSSSSPFSHSSMERRSLVSSALGQKFSQPMRAGFSPPINHTTMFKKRAVTHPLAFSQLGASTDFCGSSPKTRMMLNEQYGRHGNVSGCNNLQVKQRKNNPVEEIVVISDDEENEIDLTLKL